MAWLWGTYGGLRDHVLMKSFLNNPATFSRVAEHNDTSLSMSFFKVRLFDISDRVYEKLAGFTGPTDAYFSNIVEVTLHQREDVREIDGRTQVQFLNVSCGPSTGKNPSMTRRKKIWRLSLIMQYKKWTVKIGSVVMCGNRHPMHCHHGDADEALDWSVPTFLRSLPWPIDLPPTIAPDPPGASVQAIRRSGRSRCKPINSAKIRRTFPAHRGELSCSMWT